VDLEVSRGELVCLTGRSGAGKTTLLNIVSGLQRADEGEVLLGGQNLNGTIFGRTLPTRPKRGRQHDVLTNRQMVQ